MQTKSQEREIFMKKCINVLGLCLLMMSIMMSTVAFASNEIKVAIDGEYVEFDVKPQLINDRTMVPLRAIFEALGAEVDWDNDTQTVIAIKDDVVVTATIGSTKMYINDEERTMDVAPMIIGDRTLVPVRFVAEAFECDVDWDGDNNIVYIENHNEILPMDEYNNLTKEELYEMNS